MQNVHDKALKLPLRPGVYIMRDSDGNVIYVGKAKKLKNRVSSYFRENPNHDYKTRMMVKNVSDFDYIVTDTEFEALVLENTLIKRYMPKYNILLKDDKGYPYIRLGVTDAYPRFSIVSKPSDDGAKYFGPYSGRSESRKAIDAICRTFKLPECNKRFTSDIKPARPCLNYHLDKCMAVCSGNVTTEIYKQSISRAIMLLEGKADKIIASLTEEMNAHAESLEFELAAKLRDEVNAISALEKKQKIISSLMADTDFVAVYSGNSKTVFSVLHYIDGTLIESENRMVDTPFKAEQAELLGEFCKSYYISRERIPKTIYTFFDFTDRELLAEVISSKIIVPQRGEKLALVKMAYENAKQNVTVSETRAERTNRTLVDLQKLLALNAPPKRIESYDISNTAGQDNVASLVVFNDGSPSKSDYKMYKIQSVDGADDCACMREVLSRRLKRLVEGNDGFSKAPDLILVDGAFLQTRAASSVVEEFSLSIPVFGMVKDSRHRTRAIVNSDGAEIGISANPAVFRLIAAIQDEVHRFAINYHKKLRSGKVLTSELTEIPGVGKSRAEALLKTFKTVSRIRDASLSELKKAVPENVAASVYSYFKGESK